MKPQIPFMPPSPLLGGSKARDAPSLRSFTAPGGKSPISQLTTKADLLSGSSVVHLEACTLLAYHKTFLQ